MPAFLVDRAMYDKLSKLAPTIGPVTEAPAGGRLALSPERLSELTSDILMCGAMPEFEQKFKELPGYNDLPSVKSGGMTFLDTLTISAINTPTALSVPYVLERLNPTFAAVGK